MEFDLDKMYCGVIRRGDIFLYEEKGKEKAVVVLQEDILNQGLPTVVCASIEPYEKGEKVFPNEVLLKASETGLGKDGLVMLHKLVTVDRRNMIAKKGELKLERLAEIYKALEVNLGRFRDH